MELNEYQKQAMTTCMPESDNLAYMAFNLAGETGEFCGKVAKFIRKGKLHITTTERNEQGKITHTQIWNITPEERELMLSELGDVLWQTAGAAHSLGVSLEDIASQNLAKLASRQQRGVIDGSGDDR